MITVLRRRPILDFYLRLTALRNLKPFPGGRFCAMMKTLCAKPFEGLSLPCGVGLGVQTERNHQRLLTRVRVVFANRRVRLKAHL